MEEKPKAPAGAAEKGSSGGGTNNSGSSASGSSSGSSVFGKKLPSLSSIASSVSRSNLLRKLAGGVGAATNFTSGVLREGGRQASRSVLDSFEDPGFILFIAGLFTFLTSYLGNNYLAIIIGTIFMFFTALFIFKGKNIIFVTVFWVVYVLLGGQTVSLSQLGYYLVIALALGMVAHGLFTASKKEGFTTGAFGEFTGLVPILFFLLSLGLIEVSASFFSLTLSSPLQAIILYTPWWAMLGIFTTERKNLIITLARVLAFLYIFGILIFGIVPEAYGEAQSRLPGPEQLLEAKQQVQEQLPQGENPAVSNLVCIFTKFDDITGCVKSRQEDAQARYFCENMEKRIPGTTSYEKCVSEKKKELQSGIQVKGAIDPAFKKLTKAELATDKKYFPGTDVRQKGEAPRAYPVNLVIENPRNLNFTVTLGCDFTPKKKKGEAIVGEIKSGEAAANAENTVGVRGESTFGRPFDCYVPKDKWDNFHGEYLLNYTATFTGLSTASRLNRVFIGTKSDAWKTEWMPQIVQKYFPSETSYVALAPAEFVRINFWLTNSEKPYLIEGGDRKLSLSSNVENLAKGKIIGPLSYRIFLDGFEAESSDYSAVACKAGEVSQEKVALSSSAIIYLPKCFLSLPEELRDPEQFVPKEFEADLVYNYQITHQEGIVADIAGEESSS